MLIPWLDSAPAQPRSLTLARAFRSSAGAIEWTVGGLLVEGSDLAGVIAEDLLFYGFDEVMVFERRPVSITAPPIVASAVDKCSSRRIAAQFVEGSVLGRRGPAIRPVCDIRLP